MFELIVQVRCFFTLILLGNRISNQQGVGIKAEKRTEEENARATGVAAYEALLSASCAVLLGVTCIMLFGM